MRPRMSATQRMRPWSVSRTEVFVLTGIALGGKGDADGLDDEAIRERELWAVEQK